jgi:hypothetical protein
MPPAARADPRRLRHGRGALIDDGAIYTGRGSMVTSEPR